jgi:diguanylate cyclase (GGDEF)-like protein/PAS domain S-box-containing protein
LVATIIMALIVVLIIGYQLPASLLLLLMVPVCILAFSSHRAVYLVALVIASVATVWVLYQQNPDPRFIVGPLALAVGSALVISEYIHYRVQRFQKTEEAQQESELKFRRFVEQSEDGIVLADEQGAIIEWNSGQEEISGLRRGEVLGKPIWEVNFKLQPEENKNRANYEKSKIMYLEFLKTGHIQRMNQVVDQVLSRPDGNNRLVQQLTFPIKTDKGWMTGSINRDLSEVKKTEKALQEAHHKLTIQVNELEKRNQEANLLNEMGDLLQSGMLLEDAYAVVGQYAEKAFPKLSGILFVLNDSHNLFESVSSWGNPTNTEPVFPPEACWAQRRGRPHLVNDQSNRLYCQHMRFGSKLEGLIPYLCLPLTAQGETLGVLHLQGKNGESVEPALQLAEAISIRVALALANLKLRESLRMQSIRDPLTGLFNRRYMEETLERELHRAARHQLPLAVVMLDLDYFKKFNDAFGHQAGDTLLKEIGTFLQASVRSEDVPCRYGGEEFIVILPDVSLEDALKRTEQLHAGIKAMKVQYGGQPLGAITVSQGIACFPEHGASSSQLLRSVDAALYRAKRAGRDRVVIAEA